jgi:hypothetical protein
MNSSLDKVRTLQHYTLQEINATILNGIGDEQLRGLNNFALAFIAGFTIPDSLIFQDLALTPKAGVGNEWTLESGIQGVFILRKSAEEAIIGIYRGNRPDKISPYVSEDLVFSIPDATNDRIDIIEADIVEEEDTDYFDIQTYFNTITKQSYPNSSNTKRVQQVKLYIKEGIPSGTPVAPAKTSGRMVLAEILVRAGQPNFIASDIKQLDIDPSLNPWSIDHETRVFPAIYEVSQAVENALYNVVMGAVPGWNYAPVIGGGTIEEPDQYLFTKGALRIRLSVVWGTTGGGDGNPTQITYEFSDDNGSIYTPIGTSSAPLGIQTITYDVNSNVTAVAWT